MGSFIYKIEILQDKANKMTTELHKLAGEEFIKRFMDGERDFSHIELQSSFKFNQHPAYNEFQKYLQSINLKDSPLIFIGSQAFGVDFSSLYLPFTKAYDATLIASKFVDCLLHNSILVNANVSHAKFHLSDLRHVDWYNTTMGYTNFQKSDLRESKNFGYARGIESAKFSFNRMDQGDFIVIQHTSKKKTLERELLK